MVKVTDAAEALNYNGALDFHDGADADIEYTYDNNGALTKDGNRGINSITYDYGHHPYYINMNMTSGPRNIRNDYTPDGRKLSSKHVMSFRMVNGFIRKTTTDLYIDGLILRGDTTLLWQFDGGYVDLDANGTPTCWNYYVTDHLGSTRMVVSSNDSIRETINYYPFGSEMRMELPAQMTSDPSHPFRFTGKELDKQNGLNMYDFGARLFDVAGVPMWTSVDPLAEKYYNVTPYSYCAGDPVNKLDPDGREKIDALDPNIANNKEQIKASENFSDEKDVINVWAHGSSNGMTVYDKENGTTSHIKDAKSFASFLDKNSNVWKNRDESQNVTIVLHSCETGQLDKSGENFAQRLSKGLDNVTIIAPTDNVYTPHGKELGTYKSTVEQNINEKGQVVFSPEYQGKWVQYENGQRTQTYKGNSHPGEKGYNIVTSRSSMWDKIKHTMSNWF